MTKGLHALILLFSLLILSPSAHTQSLDTIRAMAYNLLNFPNGRDDCGTNIVIPARWDSMAIIMDYALPDILMVCELQNEFGADSLLNRALNINGRSNYARADFIVNQSTFASNLNNMLFYNTNKLGLYRQEIVITNLRDISKYTLYVKDSSLAATLDTTFLDVYVGHLDAGTSDSLSRLRQADSLRATVDTNATVRNALFGGDLNFYSSSECGYQRLLSGTYPFIDPINTPGNWNNNGTFAGVHSQSTRAAFTTPMDCGATGGLDDRFDFVLTSAPIMTGAKRIRYLPGSYISLGNNGSAFNRSINEGTNTAPIPFAVKHALHHSSDHLPVMMDLELTYTTPLGLNLLHFEGKILEATNQLTWSLENLDQSATDIALEASTDGRNFTIIEERTSSNALIEARTVDHRPILRTTYYRLKWKTRTKQGISPVIAVENINVQNLPNFQVFPNPVTDQTRILLSSALTTEATIYVYDMLGRCVWLKKLSANCKEDLLDLSILAPGAYTIVLKNEAWMLKKKIMK